jgi:UDPglucose 6-dehydrogenase
MTITIGIVGSGFCGSATAMFASTDNIIKAFDLLPERCSPGVTKIEDLKDCDFIMICVNTPMIKETGQCHTGIVEKVIQQCRTFIDPDFTTIVVRSTVPVGFCRSQNVVSFCEYLTEANWKQDVLNTKEWIVGLYHSEDEVRNGSKDHIKQKFTTMINNVFPHTTKTFIQSDECEMIKYFRNCFLATKVSFCNEMYRFCEAANVDYKVVREFATHDERIGVSHTLVPGPDKRYGFGLSCLSKDPQSLLYQMKSKNVESRVLQGAVDRNILIDRVERDWEELKGRAVI